MSFERLKAVSAANAELARFFERAAALSEADAGPLLTETLASLPALAAAIESAGRALQASPLSESPEPESTAAVQHYAANLTRLRDILPALQASAELRRDRLAGEAQKIQETLAWSSILKLTATD